MSCLTPERREAGKRDVRALTEKIRADAGGLEIFYAKAKRISLRHTLGYRKQLVLTHLLMVRLVEKAPPDESP